MKKLLIMKNFLFLSLFILGFGNQAMSFEDHSFYSKEFNSERFYRIYLPSGYYENTGKRYPVIYYFHGWGGRYKWDTGSISYDPYFKGKPRQYMLYVDEWEDYVKNHDVIIVTWDGYDPKYQPGIHETEGIKHGGCQPYDYLRAHNLNRNIRGWDFRKYFRELVAHIDSSYRTLADRNHRGVTGLSMGGLMSNYIGGQCKDLVNSVSSFCPADNYPLFGIKGQQVVFPVLEMYRSLKGVYVRLTMTDGDWLKYNDLAMNQLWSAADLTHYEFHIAHFRDHSVADADEQLDFHMKYFSDKGRIPQSWSYVSPGFPTFKIFGYEGNIEWEEPALIQLDKYNDGKIKIVSRRFFPDGPILQKETINLKTDLSFDEYKVTAYNLSTHKFSHPVCKNKNNKLSFKLGGGGSLVGINGGDIGNKPRIFVVDKYNRDCLYFEEGKEYGLDLSVINAGNRDADKIEITARSTHIFLSFINNKITLNNLKSASAVEKNNSIRLKFARYYEETAVGNIQLEIKVNGAVVDTQKIIFYETPKSPYVRAEDVVVLDGRTVKNVPVYHQGEGVVHFDSLSGGKGNGNGILEKGEEALVYIRLPKGGGCNDTNTFHRTYLLNTYEDSFVDVNNLRYDERIRQAAATSASSIISISDNMPKRHELDLWFRVEILYNDYNDPTAINGVYAYKYDYRRVKFEK